MMLQRAKLGMAMFLLNQAVFFFMLIAGFVYFQNPGAPTGARSLNLGETAIHTAFLAASSLTMWRAAASVNRGNASSLGVWLAGTILLGAAFLLGQAGEYVRLFHRNITVSQNLFGSTFFTLTGLHGLHVLVGILLLGMLFFAQAGERRSVAVQTVALYWYFVAAVRIGIFAVVYLGTFS